MGRATDSRIYKKMILPVEEDAMTIMAA